MKIFKNDLDIILKFISSDKIDVVFEDYSKITDYSTDDETLVTFDTKGYSKILINFSSKKLELNGFDYIVDFGKNDIKECSYKDYSFINNNDGSMRWIFPSDIKKPTFLSFYNTQSLKTIVMSKMLRFLYFFNLGKYFCSGNFRVYYNKPLKVERLIRALSPENYSIFTGTVGPNRKLLIELNKNGETTHFIKWGISNQSEKLVEFEFENLAFVNELELKNTIVAKPIKSPQMGLAVYNNIKPEIILNCNKLSEIHFKSLLEIYSKTINNNSFDVIQFRKDLIDNIYSLSPDKRIQNSERIIELLSNNVANINFNAISTLTFAHFDFTPWNMYVSNEKLYLYDWELARHNIPVFFDLYHYVFQKCILIEHKSLGVIKNEIAEALAHPLLKKFIVDNDIDIEITYKTYLLFIISYYLKIYAAQGKLHMQVSWLTNVWLQALEEMEGKEIELPKREIFIHQFFAELNQYNYALLKFSERKIDSIAYSSDLDILIKRENLESIIKFISEYRGVEKVKSVKKSFMGTLAIFFKDGSFLSIDLIYQFKRKYAQMLDADCVLKNITSTAENVKIPQLNHDFEYILLFYQLNYADVPSKYIAFFNSLNPQKQEDIVHYLSRKYNLGSSKGNDIFKFDHSIRNKIEQTINQSKENKGWLKWKNTVNYIIDLSTEIFLYKGLVMTMSGVDGAGKSTIIEEVKQIISTKFRKKVVVIRHRPSILPILSAIKYGKEKAEAISASRLPRQGKNSSTFSSAIRFAYYYTDYIVGQVYIYAKYVLRGYTVIYDRYYFDFIEDAKRTNLKLNKSLVKWLYRFIYKPKLNIFLYAPPDVILKRKQEMNEVEIKALTSDYYQLFKKYDSSRPKEKYMSIENIDKTSTLETIVKEYVKVV